MKIQHYVTIRQYSTGETDIRGKIVAKFRKMIDAKEELERLASDLYRTYYTVLRIDTAGGIASEYIGYTDNVGGTRIWIQFEEIETIF